MDAGVFAAALAQAGLKIQRAYRHAAEAEAFFRQYLSTDFCQLREERDPQTGAQVFQVVAAELPLEIALSIGDALHNLSTALDYVATGLLRSVGASTTRFSFPLDDSRQTLRQTFKRPAPGKKAPRNRRIVEHFPSFVRLLLNVIKPYQNGGLCVWEVRKLDNTDKHNLIIPTLTVMGLRGLTLLDAENQNSMNDVTMQVLPGGTLNILSCKSLGAMQIVVKGQPLVSMTFPSDIEVFAGQHVFPTLLQCLQSTQHVLNIVEGANLNPFRRAKAGAKRT